jgi:ribosomal protein S17E
MVEEGSVRRMLENLFNINMAVLRDVNNYSSKKENGEKFDRAYNWVFGYGVGMPFSFNNVCRRIGYVPNKVRNVVSGYLEKRENSEEDNKEVEMVFEEVA